MLQEENNFCFSTSLLCLLSENPGIVGGTFPLKETQQYFFFKSKLSEEIFTCTWLTKRNGKGHTIPCNLICTSAAFVWKGYFNIKYADRSSESCILMQKLGVNNWMQHTLYSAFQKEHQLVTEVNLREEIHTHIHSYCIQYSLVTIWRMALYHGGKFINGNQLT